MPDTSKTVGAIVLSTPRVPGAHARPGVAGGRVARVVVLARAGAVHRRDEHVLEVAGPAAASPAPRRRRAGSTGGWWGLSAEVSPAAERGDEVRVGRAAAGPGAAVVQQPCPSGPAVPPKPYGETGATRATDATRSGASSRYWRTTPAPMLQPTRCTRSSPSASISVGEVVRPVPHAAGGVDRQRRRCRRSRAGRRRATRCRPVSAIASIVCCQNSAELTLPCTNSTASPGPAGSVPAGCSTDWVSRGGRQPAWRRCRAAGRRCIDAAPGGGGSGAGTR